VQPRSCRETFDLGGIAAGNRQGKIMSTLEVVQEMLMKEFDLTRDQVHPASNLSDLGVDSLATIEFLFLLEERFNLDLNSEPVPINTVGEIALEVDRLLAESVATTDSP
jgi:acyl carrier protein